MEKSSSGSGERTARKGLRYQDRASAGLAYQTFVEGIGRVAYSVGGRRWQEVEGTFPLAFDWQTDTCQSVQLALYCYNPRASAGYLYVDSFTLTALPGGVAR